ncbi:MAG: pyruvate, phosphate dikinase [Candidatus Zixiibacteriota bacterium]|nr:MAG: pyruvate, phosphate dikinase [candidate division Zixibacteria bacterium]
MPAKKTSKKAKKSVKKKAPSKKKPGKKASSGKKTVKKAKKEKKKSDKAKKVTTTKKEIKPEVEIKGKYIYYFGDGIAEGRGNMKDLLGGKGAGLAEMTNTGVPVPPGFTITTDVCKLFYENNMELPKSFEEEMRKYIAKLEKSAGMGFGNKNNPLLVSVRSGAKFSMPGMMDTVLNLGLNDETLQGLIKKTDNERFAYDSYRRFVQMFGNVVLGIDKSEFEEILEKRKKKQRIAMDTELTVDDLKYIIKKFKALILEKTGEEFPQDPLNQLVAARDAVFKSWNNPRAITYRHLNDIPSGLGTAVNIQTMVFGNMGDNSATGVGFTRNPSTGGKEFYGEYLSNAQGEDVVAGIRTPRHISNLAKEMPRVHKQLKDITTKLEKHYRDVQDFEFTIQEGRLYLLQTRTGKRTTAAAVKIAVDMVKEGLIDKGEALLRVEPEHLEHLLHPAIDPSAAVNVIAKGLAASPGAASGQAVFTADDAVRFSDAGNDVILVRQETNPDDIHGMNAARGILTARGGMTSHAAVVARGMGKCCVAGAEDIRVYGVDKKMIVGGAVIKEGDYITLNGTTGEVMLGQVPTIAPQLSGEFATFMKWADEIRRLRIRTNADTPDDARQAVAFGAEGIGLCRTEHMFFAPDRIPIVQEMILATDEIARREALDKLLPFQKNDFKAIFVAMDGRPVTIRTIDPPLHEFLPDKNETLKELEGLRERKAWEDEIAEKEKVLQRIDELHEFNPMLGHRGCRLGITYPEITEMQARAIFTAACEVARGRKAKAPVVEVMIPLVGIVDELKNQREIIDRVAEEVMKKHKVEIQYLVGTMIEVPRGAITADEIAGVAEFFSFGTNDLTQMTFGYSRDDAAKFLKVYINKEILTKDPFVTLDTSGVGDLIRIAVTKGRKIRHDIKLGICGEHGGDPDSIRFCHEVDLDYVSASPFRIPIARLAAAQAVLGETEYTQK